VYSQGENMLDELKSADNCSKCRCYKEHVTAHLAKGGLQVACMYSYSAAHCEVFCTKQRFHLCLKNPIDKQNTGNNIPTSVFTPKLYVRLHLCTLISFCTTKTTTPFECKNLIENICDSGRHLLYYISTLLHMVMN
jgi:hypothetical protein